MKISTTLLGIALGGIAAFVGQLNAGARPGSDGGVSTGPDVIVGSIPGYAKYYKGTINGETWLAYSLGSTSCNIGDVPLDWYASTNQHPVIPQNMYRVKNGGFEHLGMSWVKHGFCALQQTLCGPCTPAGSGCPSLLGVGCSDPYTASLNGSQSDLRPRYQINAATGYFNYGASDPTNSDPTAAKERLRVRRVDLDPALNAGATYYAECQYVHPDDAAAANDDNNASYRKFTIGADSSTGYALSLTGATFQQLAAIHAWKSVHADVEIKSVDVAGDGRYLVANRVWQITPGVWRYEYCVQNLNSDRAGYSFSVPTAAGVTATNIGFARPMYHSGEPFSNLTWTGVQASGAVTWTCPQTYAQNANGAALRWASMYTFRFESTTGPATTDGSATLGLFKTGTPASVGASVKIPGGPPPIAGDFNGDGIIDGVDLGMLLANWGTAAGDVTGDGVTDGQDLAIILANWTL
ncbi:MAG: hypothetical protein O2800_06125 [Planctomycetota bacterium]|nr:hypothetical protein [Planctomycetota bacterium]